MGRLMTSGPQRSARSGEGRRRLYLVGGLFVLMLFAGCTIPNHVGLSNELGLSATHSRTTAVVGAGSTTLRFSGWHEVQEGSLTIVVTAPDGTDAFMHTYDAVSQSTLDYTFDRQPGEWVIVATSTPGRGSFLIGLDY